MIGSLAEVTIVIKSTSFIVRKSIIVLLSIMRTSACRVVVRRVEMVPKKTIVRKC